MLFVKMLFVKMLFVKKSKDYFCKKSTIIKDNLIIYI